MRHARALRGRPPRRRVGGERRTQATAARAPASDRRAEEQAPGGRGPRPRRRAGRAGGGHPRLGHLRDLPLQQHVGVDRQHRQRLRRGQLRLRRRDAGQEGQRPRRRQLLPRRLHRRRLRRLRMDPHRLRVGSVPLLDDGVRDALAIVVRLHLLRRHCAVRLGRRLGPRRAADDHRATACCTGTYIPGSPARRRPNRCTSSPGAARSRSDT
jgi:hypothetical protein